MFKHGWGEYIIYFMAINTLDQAVVPDNDFTQNMKLL